MPILALFHVRNRWEAHRIGFSNRFLEYSFAGLAILGTPQLAAVEIAQEFEHAEFYDENNLEQMSSGLNRILDNLDDYKMRAINCKERMSWEQEAKPLVSLYGHLLSD